MGRSSVPESRRLAMTYRRSGCRRRYSWIAVVEPVLIWHRSQNPDDPLARHSRPVVPMESAGRAPLKISELKALATPRTGAWCPCPDPDACTTVTLLRAPGADHSNLFYGASDGYFQEPAGASQFGVLRVPGRLPRSSLHRRSDARRRRRRFFVVGRRRAGDRFPGSCSHRRPIRRLLKPS